MMICSSYGIKRIPPLILLKFYPTKFVLPFKQEWFKVIKFIFFFSSTFFTLNFYKHKKSINE